MPFSSEGVQAGVGLALSGGGFRATLFHCGTLWRLNELGMLAKIDRVSSVSGGSITAGVLALKWAKLSPSNWAHAILSDEVITPLRRFCEHAIDAPSILEGVLLPGKTVSEILAGDYKKHLFGDATLQDLPDQPRFVFNSTNLSTGVDFRFSKPYAGDYRIGLIERPTFSVALAVAASSAFPPFLSPVLITSDPNSFKRTPGADLYDNGQYRERLILTDGGAYDNLGLETVWKRLKTVLVSDAGAPFSYAASPAHDWLHQSLRVLDITTNQARGLRKQILVQRLQDKILLGAYWGIMTPIDRYPAAGSLPVPAAVTEQLARIRTRLNPFTEAEQCSLINWGYAVCDAAMRSYVTQGAASPTVWPYPNYALSRGLASDVKIEASTDVIEPGTGQQMAP